MNTEVRRAFLHSLSNAEKAIGSFISRGADFLCGNAANFRNFFCRKVHKPGVVAFAAVRHGGHVGAVRFQHDAVERQLLNNFNGFFAFLKVTAPPKLNFSPKSRHSNAVSTLPE